MMQSHMYIKFLLLFLCIFFAESANCEIKVIYYKENVGTLAWDHPTPEKVDHFVVEIKTTYNLAGSQNRISWTQDISVKDMSYRLYLRSGYSYQLRVKAVGHDGTESPFSEEVLEVVCDRDSPEVKFSKSQIVPAINAQGLMMWVSGTYKDRAIDSILVNGIPAQIDTENGTWSILLSAKDGQKNLHVQATDKAGNTSEKWINPSLSIQQLINEQNCPIQPQFFKIISLPSPPLLTKDSELHPLAIYYPEKKGVGLFVGTNSGLIFFKLFGNEETTYEILSNTQGAPYFLDASVWPLSIDLDPDFCYELMVGTANKRIELLRNCGSGWEYIDQYQLPMDFADKSFSYMTTLDWNMDGKKDLMVSQVDDNPKIFLNEKSTGSGLPIFGPDIINILRTDTLREAGLAAVDWDGDGDIDIIAQDRDGDLYLWKNFRQTATSTLYYKSKILIKGRVLGKGKFFPFIIDWDGDGIMDIVVGTDFGKIFLLGGVCNN